VGDRKVSNSKSDLQGHSGSPVMVPDDRPHTISYQSSTATMSLSCTISEILSHFPKILRHRIIMLATVVPQYQSAYEI